MKFALILNHFNPEWIYVVKNPSSECLNFIEERLNHFDSDYHIFNEECEDRFALLSWNDEDAELFGSGNNLNDIKKENIEAIKIGIKNWEEEDCDIEIPLIGGDLYICDASDYINNEWGMIEEFITGSFVDGDSNRCYHFLDLEEEESLIRGDDEVVFISFEDLKERFEDENTEEQYED